MGNNGNNQHTGPAASPARYRSFASGGKYITGNSARLGGVFDVFAAADDNLFGWHVIFSRVHPETVESLDDFFKAGSGEEFELTGILKGRPADSARDFLRKLAAAAEEVANRNRERAGAIEKRDSPGGGRVVENLRNTADFYGGIAGRARQFLG